MPDPEGVGSTSDHPLAAAVVAGLIEQGLTVATGESLTAGLVAATIADIPGSSAVLRGGIVAYDRDVKSELLGVPLAILDAGLVSAAVAEAMAQGAALALGARIGIGTTGVAGPEPHGGEPVGSVWVAVTAGGADADRVIVRHLDLSGDRAAIRRQTVTACLAMVAEVLDPRARE